MKFTSIVATFAVLLVHGLQAFASTEDVFDPPVLSPNATTVWKVGTRQIVTWDTSGRPAEITNPLGQIMLTKAGIATPVILASNFSILLGQIHIVVPWVLNGTDYQIVLFGDSGNLSRKFTINGSKSLF